jgi:hypothetical protein
MKQVSCLGLCAALVLVACGDDSGLVAPDAGIADSGINSRLDDLEGQLGNGINGVNSDLDELAMRVTELEQPPPPPPEPGSCSEGEDCIPDGLILSVDGLTTLVTAFCENIFGCCEENEVFWTWGPDVTDVEACVARFESFVERGLPPDFFVTGVVGNITLIAQAFNSPGKNGDPSVAFIQDGIDACAKQLEEAACAQFAMAPAFCEPPGDAPVNECAPNKVVQGLLAEGEPCNLALGGAGVPQCAEDLACVNDGSGVDGICAQQAEEGDSCAVNADCANVDASLYCHQETQRCAEFAGEKDDCTYVDPTLQFSTTQGTRCAANLNCDPETEKCVKTCSIGAGCVNNAGCPEDTVCDVTTFAAGIGGGFCREPFANGDDCTFFASECESGNCAPGGTCAPALKVFGATCSVADSFDATCESNRCGPNSKCTQVCGDDDDCPNTHYCNPDNGGHCLPRVTNGNACDDSSDCVAGSWCNGSSQCAARIADSGTCSSGEDDECVNRICNTTTCTAPLPVDTADCGVGGDRVCGPGAYCLLESGATPEDNCELFRTEGQSCSGGRECEEGLECDFHPTTPKCYPPNEYPAGAACGGGFDCLSGLCVGGRCADPAEKDEDCDTTLGMHPSCDTGLFCETDDTMTTVGTCKPQHIVGESCLPRYMGADCLNGTACNQVYGGYFCGGGAVPAMELACDGT